MESYINVLPIIIIVVLVPKMGVWIILVFSGFAEFVRHLSC
jgi:hypothetical protein